jgi:hypothetical protein
VKDLNTGGSAYIVLTATVIVNAGPDVGFPNDESPEEYRHTCHELLQAKIREGFPSEGDTESVQIHSIVVGQVSG